RLARCPLDVAIEPSSLRLPHEPWSALWPILVHVVRNAVDHGLERSDERRASGKPDRARLSLSASEQGGGVTIVIADDGRGIDWERLREVARARDLPASTHDDLVAAMLSDGVSTRAAASETSGRGVGLAAVRQLVASLGGTMIVESAPGQ